MTDIWLARSRPNAGTLDVVGVRCSCGRRLYALPGPRGIEGDFCIGCDALRAECYCPSVPRTEAVP